MAHITADRVKDTTTTTGTGSLTLANSAPTGYRTLNAVASTSDTFYYCVELNSEWEVGLGTYSGSHVFARTTVLASSNSNAAVNFSAGTKNFFITNPAAIAPSDTAYASSWDGVTTIPPSKNAVYDKFEAYMFPAAPISNNYAVVQQDASTASTSGTGAANTIYCAPFRIFRRVTITALGLHVVSTSANNAQVAIYPNVSGKPGTSPTIATGNLSTASAAAVVETLGSPVTLDPGIYWACINRDSTNQVIAVATQQVGAIATITGSATLADVLSAGPAVINHLSAARTFNSWGDISGLSYTAVAGTTSRVPVLLGRFQ